MAFDGIGDFARELETRGELTRIRAAADPVLEIPRIADLAMKNGGPALLFEKPLGAAFPLLVNAFGSWNRVAWALGYESIDEAAREVEELVKLDVPASLWDKVKQLPKYARLAGYLPKHVDRAPCQEVRMESPDLGRLPILHCWPGDPGRFITFGLVVTRDPDTQGRNLGLYRMQVFDARTTAMHWQTHKGGAHHHRKYRARKERMPVAVAIGGDPALTYAATAPLPDPLDEVIFAGVIRRDPVRLVRCLTNDLEVPAESDFVLEGYVEPDEERIEGPFGDHTGYYSDADRYPIFHLTAITHRTNAHYLTTIVGPPPMEDAFLGRATERLFLPLMKMQLPELLDVRFPPEGVFHNLCLVRIRKTYPGQARKVMHALWGMGQMMFTKILVVVDEETPLDDLREVAWKVTNSVDPQRDFEFVHGPLDVLNHASVQPIFGSKVGIDATRKTVEEGHPRAWPELARMSPEIVAQVDRRWNEYGLPSLADWRRASGPSA